MGKYKISRLFSFDSAHVLAKGYRGKCSQVHGHTWKTELTVVADSSLLDQFDMVVDFSLLKEIGEEVKKIFDHKLIIYAGDAKAVQIQDITHYDVIKLEANPTVEILTERVFQIASSYLKLKCPTNFGAYDIEVTMWETPDSKCKYTP